MSKIKFEYTNGFDLTTKLYVSFDEATLVDVDESPFDYIVDRFKDFLRVAEFSEFNINQINNNNE